jgi:SAM-dependent methyltransferase
MTGMARTETASVDARSRDLEFGSYYYAHDCGAPYERNEYWLGFFRKMAERIRIDLAPRTVLDAGCAFGMLVEELRELGVEAFGVDVSEYAISQVGETVRPFCRQASLAEPLSDRYDLITCVEVLEHIPPIDAEQAIANLCAASDRILLSSSPFDYGEPTHVNIRPPEDWAASFAKHGFVADLDVDLVDHDRLHDLEELTDDTDDGVVGAERDNDDEGVQT